MWHRVGNLRRDPRGQITAEVDFPAESRWVRGHFPGDPVIPAMAQLAVVREVLEGLGPGEFVFRGLKRVKFKALVRPGERLRLEISPKAAGQYGFRLLRDQEVVCSGVLEGELEGGEFPATANRNPGRVTNG